jgi:hypothetical protein
MAVILTPCRSYEPSVLSSAFLSIERLSIGICYQGLVLIVKNNILLIIAGRLEERQPSPVGSAIVFAGSDGYPATITSINVEGTEHEPEDEEQNRDNSRLACTSARRVRLLSGMPIRIYKSGVLQEHPCFSG